MADLALDQLIGRSSSVLDKLGALGEKAAAASKAWEGLVGPAAAASAPSAPAAPAASPKSFVPSSGFMGLSLSAIVAGAAALGLLIYLVIKGD